MGVRFERIARAGWPVLAGLLLGLAVGGIWTLVEPNRYRAETRLLVHAPDLGRVVPAVEALAESSLLEQNVAQTLRLAQPPQIVADSDKGGLLTLSVQAGSRERARQIDAEAALVLMQKITERFGQARIGATVLDPAHSVEQTSPRPARNLLLSGLLGLALGSAFAATRIKRRFGPAPAGSVDPAADNRLKARVDAVSKRERVLARRAGELARTEQDLGRREESLARRTQDLERRWRTLDERDGKHEQGERRLAEGERELQERERKLHEGERELVAAQTAPAPGPPPEPFPATDEMMEPPAPAGPGRTPTLDVLERRVAERRAEFPDQAVEWDSYLFFLREHADADGRLPAQFGGLVWEIFSPLLD